MDNPSCIVGDCGKPVHVKKRGLCRSHYQRWCKYGDPQGAVILQYTLECTFDGCSAQRRYDQLCMGHYNQIRKGRKLAPLRRLTDPTVRSEGGMKQCRRCDQWLPESAYSTNKARRDRLTAYCRRCERDKALSHNYGISLSQYELMLEAQGNGCAVCGGLTKDGRPLAVDHDHGCCPGQRTCGRCIRGLLCGECNLGFGYFNDDVRRMEVAIAYLRDMARARTPGAA